jgi:hypothetical protein
MNLSTLMQVSVEGEHTQRSISKICYTDGESSCVKTGPFKNMKVNLGPIGLPDSVPGPEGGKSSALTIYSSSLLLHVPVLLTNRL